MKKIVGLLLTAFVIAALLSGCGSKTIEEIPEGREIQPQAVMINGKLYYNTDQTITLRRCGVMDGEIKYTTDEYSLPQKDNQSNFGTGYEYQRVDEHHYDIPMDNPEGWIRFCDGDCEDSHQESLCSLPPDFVGSQPCILFEIKYSATNAFTGKGHLLSENDGLTISDILANGEWNTEGTADCLNNIELVINGETYYYHSDCGTFNDNTNQRSLTVDEETKAEINSIISECLSAKEIISD
ncbi:MAG: hypothetical protein IJ410_00155 [Oscillospiraceae bacterium]|nr:hypothetical protein [Oscillospiraceae bacterium]